MSILAAWGRAGGKLRFIRARHEEMAAFEAAGYAKLTGRVGVCFATSDPGAIHLLNGLYLTWLTFRGSQLAQASDQHV